MRKSLKNTFKSIIAISLVFFLTNSVYAEDRLDALPMSGITLSPELNKNVKLKKQKIKISEDNIKIEYTFLNQTDKTLNGKISFILPKTPNDYNNPDAFSANSATWDESYYTLERQAINKLPINNTLSQTDKEKMLASLDEARKTAAFINFSISVDDQKIVPKYEMTAKIGQEDIANKLIKNKIPLSATFAGGQSGILLEAGENIALGYSNLKAKLKKLKLYDTEGMPAWANQSTYSWNQAFNTNKLLKITLSYRPAKGYTTLSDVEKIEKLMKENVRYTDDSTRQRTIENFCPSPSFVKYLHAALSSKPKKDNESVPIREVDLINYPIGETPIEEFHLEIIPPKNGEMAMCWPEPLRFESGKYIAAHKNFIPPKEIEVLFVGNE